MNIINVTEITKSYTERKLFDKASFYLQEREKVGVIGINGTGKSTLLKIIAGIEEPDEGQVIKANHVVVRYLPQNPAFDPEHTVLETVLYQCSRHYVGGDLEKRDTTDVTIGAADQWNLESDAKSMMTKLGITNFNQKARRAVRRTEEAVSPCGRTAPSMRCACLRRADQPPGCGDGRLAGSVLKEVARRADYGDA